MWRFALIQDLRLKKTIKKGKRTQKKDVGRKLLKRIKRKLNVYKSFVIKVEIH